MNIKVNDNIINISNNDNSTNIINCNFHEGNSKYLLIIKKDTTILYACETFIKEYGEAIGNKLSDIFSNNLSKIYEKVRKLILESLFTGKNINSDIVSDHSGRVFRFSISPVSLDKDNEILLINAYDITRISRLYEEIEELKKSLEDSNSIKNIFLSNISHELRTPMNSIVGFSNILIQCQNTDEEIKSFMNSIYSNAKYLDELLNNILDYSKIESNEFDILYENFSIKDLFEELKDLFKDVNYKKNLNLVNLEFIIDDDRKIISDYLRLKQVLFNIISNSIKFTDNGSIKISCKIENKVVMFIIEDTGIGIPDDKIKYVFDRFWQCDSTSTKKYKGTGIGLSLSKGIIELLGGEISLESKLNVGTKFTVKIPLEEIKQEILIKSKDKINFSGRTVLIVDEFPINYSLLGIYLNSFDIDILSAYDSEDAIEIFKKQKEKIDIIFIDLSLPKNSGFELAEKLKKIHDKCIIISKSGIKKQKNNFFDYHLKKPIIKDKLLNLLNELWQK